jgi:hypothetical protein
MGTVATDRIIDMIQRGERGIPSHPVSLTVTGVWRGGGSVREGTGRIAGFGEDGLSIHL